VLHGQAEGRVISSRMTFFYKRVFPVVWLGFLAVMTAILVFVSTLGGPKAPPVAVAIVPVFLMAFGYVLVRKLIFDLMDEVREYETYLTVRYRGQEDRIDLANIMNITFTPMMSPPRATLVLRNPGKFGKEVTFCPLIPFFHSLKTLGFKNAVVNELIEKVDARRMKAAKT
jgi:hypothetical protein